MVKKSTSSTREPISAALLAAIAASGRTDSDLARAAGVDRAVIGRFRRGERSVSLAVADALAAALGLVLRRSR